MSRPPGKQAVSARGIFARKPAQKNATAPKAVSHYDMKKGQPSPPPKARVSKGFKGSKGSKQAKSTHIARHSQRAPGSSKGGSSNSTSMPGGERLLHNFVDSIDSTRTQIQEEVSISLAEAEQVLEKRLAQTVSKYSEKLSISRNTRKDIFLPVEIEHPTISLKPKPSLVQGADKDKAHLVDVRNSLDAHEQALKSHWKAWSRTQQKIACLAVEILGPDAVSLPPLTKDAMGSGTFQKRLARATDAFEKNMAAVEGKMIEDAQKTRDDIACLLRDMRKQVNIQEKKSRDGKRKQREEICQLTKKIIASI
ncbi:hypothetical protein PAAG_07491 [Paracoccidioides lutzii Pb01]|uniref:Uncharacterized protein n=1 Tax=Paracoccidioides lutzii (strain ATCC MYA-826 / Pb01) TaxID=502779 RepID=C1H9Q0_PARBA|nr:hypothetical protein PAAG_07491 [Paracoccidioides lutzii Pb01]EEH37073.2 hypothetical protein PAAG_07491 [Paracoccidioides lutzii Pb01]